jgi:hypothetical protein
MSWPKTLKYFPVSAFLRISIGFLGLADRDFRRISLDSVHGSSPNRVELFKDYPIFWRFPSSLSSVSSKTFHLSKKLQPLEEHLKQPIDAL